MNKEKLIIFDCDGTLVDTESIHSEVISRKFAEYGLVQFTPKFVEENLIGYGSDFLNQIIRENLPDHIKFNTFGSLEKVNSLEIQSIRNRVKPINGMHELLEEIDFNVSIASNGLRDIVIESLKSTGLIKFFEEKFIHTAAEVNFPKPKPDLFLHTANKRNILASNCLVIEDSHVGVLAAQLAGMQVIALIRDEVSNTKNSRKIKELKPNYIVGHPSQILGILTEF